MGRDFRGGRRIEGVVYYLHREMRMENPRFGDCITCWTRFVFFALLCLSCIEGTSYGSPNHPFMFHTEISITKSSAWVVPKSRFPSLPNFTDCLPLPKRIFTSIRLVLELLINFPFSLFP